MKMKPLYLMTLLAFIPLAGIYSQDWQLHGSDDYYESMERALNAYSMRKVHMYSKHNVHSTRPLWEDDESETKSTLFALGGYNEDNESLESMEKVDRELEEESCKLDEDLKEADREISKSNNQLLQIKIDIANLKKSVWSGEAFAVSTSPIAREVYVQKPATGGSNPLISRLMGRWGKKSSSSSSTSRTRPRRPPSSSSYKSSQKRNNSRIARNRVNRSSSRNKKRGLSRKKNTNNQKRDKIRNKVKNLKRYGRKGFGRKGLKGKQKFSRKDREKKRNRKRKTARKRWGGRSQDAISDRERRRGTSKRSDRKKGSKNKKNDRTGKFSKFDNKKDKTSPGRQKRWGKPGMLQDDAALMLNAIFGKKSGGFLSNNKNWGELIDGDDDSMITDSLGDNPLLNYVTNKAAKKSGITLLRHLELNGSSFGEWAPTVHNFTEKYEWHKINDRGFSVKVDRDGKIFAKYHSFPKNHKTLDSSNGWGLFKNKGQWNPLSKAAKKGGALKNGLVQKELEFEITDLKDKLSDEVVNGNPVLKEEKDKKIAAYNEARDKYIEKYKLDGKLGNDKDWTGTAPIKDGDYTLGGGEKYRSGAMHKTSGAGNKARDFMAKQGTAVYLTTDQNISTKPLSSSQFLGAGWYLGKSDETKTGYNNGEKTKGDSYGYCVLSTDSDNKYYYGHLKADSQGAQVAKDLNDLIKKAKEAGLDEVSLPKGTQVGEVGYTGITTAPHVHYEKKKLK